MSINEALRNVMQLQPAYSSEPTEAMQARGRIVRELLPAIIKRDEQSLRELAGVDPTDFLIEGRDGIGRKSQVPWVRFSSRKLSPSATVGWYAVFLFAENGQGVYLSIAHASTEKVDGDLINRPADETRRLLGWARAVLETELREDSRLTTNIELGKGTLARAYQRTTVASYFYPLTNLPSDDQLRGDMGNMAKLLREIYRAQHAQKFTGETSLEVIAALDAIEQSASGRSFALGHALSQLERRAIEMQAKNAATDHFKAEGYLVEDTSANNPFDLRVTRGNEVLYIEVKGTTGPLGDVVLTKNEVNHHQKHYPANGLFVLYSIKLNKVPGQPAADGGVQFLRTPWQLEESRLQPLAYRYRVT